MSYNFSAAKEKVSNNDMLRFACLYLNRRADGTVDWDKATAEFGAKSIDSMRVCTNAALKKIENAGGKTGASASATPKKGGGRKRKVTPADNDDDEEATPIIKKKGRKSKKMTGIPAESNTEDAAGTKGEPNSEGEGEGEGEATS